MKESVHKCSNCNNVFKGNYCNACGQKVAHRLDTKHVINEIFHVFTHTDKSIFYFIPIIMFKPGTFALNYVEGKRKRYFSVFQYLIIVVGIITFLMTKTHYMENVAVSFDNGSGNISAKVQEVQERLTSTIQRYLNLFLFALIPVFAYFNWLLFKSKKYNYAENFVLQMAVQAQINTYTLIIIMPLTFLLHKENHFLIVLVSLLILFTCTTVSNRQFFKVSWLQGFWKGLLVYVFTNIVQFIIIFIVVFIIVLNSKK